MPLGILLVNLGSPASPDVADVRSYLDEFLMDEYVISLPRPLRRLLVSAFILPFRPKRTAAAYAAIWTPEGSPLIQHTRHLRDAVAGRIDTPLAIAMRYGEPSIDAAVSQLIEAGADEILLIPLYPQYADSTVTTIVETVEAQLPDHVRMRVQPPFFDDEGYLSCQTDLIAGHLPQHWDHLLLSYHGLPEAHLRKADPTHRHCLATEDCCQTSSAAHATCYRHQAFSASEEIANRLGIPAEKWSVSFQSRAGREPWLKPYTEELLQSLPGEGVRNLVIACPAFVADNLETLEEIGMRGRDTFLAAGGTSFTLVPCLNDTPQWAGAIAHWCGVRRT
ncbi:MAG: ferrochelatase [Pseudomonadales bacterium]|jgi:ferrochelatase|nr:ferrochelatase [Pseudomonadales bacterium]MDP6471610.1 ferrochelatase [Pseudomonadales bacterium]MDP6828873.1 ferrochelatase [Pseudomonadales bacterium]MDP6970595.1 ferrochelatase [Pseudomonadales bacterium]|tara:strand:- start:1755 stop:2759 length:1005 start_codon:yes stop_codon:yes gene_type:complete